MDQNKTVNKTALLVMDIQGLTIKMLGDSTSLLNSLNQSIQIARSNEIPVIFVVVGFRKGYPEVSENNKSFSALSKNTSMSLDTEEAASIPASVAQDPADIIVVKKRVSAFSGSDLEVVLRSLGITHIVLTGIATSGVILSTLREAADKDYAITVLSDCCADLDDEVHRVLMTKIFKRQAEVMKAQDWNESL
jgi:nicotinamidase-related amidase